jgi:tripartite ATP-independent transporter DctM subunit
MNMALLAFGLMFVVVFLSRMPISYGFLSIGVVYFMVKGGNIGIVANQVCNTYWTQYIIIAVPLFIFSANVMNSGKVTEMLFKFADGLVGRFRGGMAHVNIVASLIFSGMTGSAQADAAGLGVMEIQEMRNQGYDDDFSCAITAASATIGPIFPPSMPMLIYSSLTGASVGALFMGGMVPGVLLAIFLCGYTAFIANKRKYPYGVHYTLATFIAFTIKSVPALLTPVILLGGIYGGVVTPTEAGALAGLWALIVSIFIYRALGWTDLRKILVDTVVSTGTVALTIGCASVILYISSRERIPALLGGFIMDFTDNKYMFLFIVNLLFLFLGMLFDSTTITLVFIPMLMPLVKEFNIDLVHFGVLFTVNMMIGMLTPPYGTLLFTVSAISQVKLGGIIREVFPMIIVMIGFLLLITYFPPIITFLPELLL